MVNYKKVKTFVKQCLASYSSREEKIALIFEEYIDSDVEKGKEFAKKFAEIKGQLEKDCDFFLECDPAADSKEEIKSTYPGFLAITNYRIAHIVREMGYLVESRIISEITHSKTGIDIHPGAKIGVPFFIDHGTGIVIGETAIVGKRVRLYQGVTLGALSLAKGAKLKGTKRHPTIGDDVIIYSNASVLGDVTVGDDVTIGSSVFLMKDVPSHTKVTIGEPILVVKQKD